MPKLPRIKVLVVYLDDASKLREKHAEYKGLILGWNEFLALAEESKALKSEL